MKTILAHWKKDLISSRSMLIGWAVCIALAGIFFIIRVVDPNPAWLHPQPGSENLPKVMAAIFAMITGIVGLMGVQFLLLALLVIHVIHLDPLTNPDAFWRTRPISGGALLAAKSLFIALLVLGAGLSVASLKLDPAPGVHAFLGGLVFVIGLVAFASITTSLSQLILHWLAIIILAGLSAHVLLAAWQLTLASLHGSSFNVTFSQHISTISATDPLWLAVLYLAGFLAAILCQYFTLRTNFSRAILFATFFLSTLLQNRF